MAARKRLLPPLGAALATCGLVGALLVACEVEVPAPPQAGVAAVSVVAADFIGAESCATCHQEQYDLWAGSTHGRAGGAAEPDRVIAPFDATPIRFADAVVLADVAPDSTYRFVLRQQGFPERIFAVDGVVGGGHMVGGGTQGFFTRTDDGLLRFLPWDWSRQTGVWFCNTGTRLDEGWMPITESMRLADCGDWPPARILGTEERYQNCQECHGSQIETRYDPSAKVFTTEYTTLAINCESCHGPGRAHIERVGRGEIPGSGDIGLTALATLDKDASLEVCFRCHALKDVVREDYLPGKDFEEHYALKFPILGDEPYLADGRIATFAYQAPHLASACYLSGSMSCVSCHEPHAQGYWDENRRPLRDRFDNGQCTSCHPSKLDGLEAHTFHPTASEGSQCVSCHMPYLQHPEVGDGIRFARSDHMIPLPRPGVDEAMGVTSACALCHRDRSVTELQAQARAWYGDLKPHRPLVQSLLEPDGSRSRTELALALLQPGENDPLSQFTALSRFVLDHLQPDDPALEPDVRDRLAALTESPDLDVRGLALAGLHWAAGADPIVQSHLSAASDTRGTGSALMGRWVLGLSFMGDRYRDREAFGLAVVAYQKAIEVNPSNPKLHRGLGIVHNQARNYGGAMTAFRRSLELDPAQPLVLANLGIAQAGLGQENQAITSYTRAIELNPHEPLAHLNLGNLYLRRGDGQNAEQAYEGAVTADPGMARAHYNLARARVLLGRYREALPAARRALELEPDNDGAAQMITDLESTLRGRSGAGF